MQMPLPLADLDTVPELGWVGLDPVQRVEAVGVLARLMAKVLNPQPQQHEEHSSEQF